MTWLTELLRRPPISWWDIADITLVSFIIYELLTLIRGTRAVQMAVGGAVIVGLFYLSGLSQLETVNFLIRNFVGYVVFAIIVLFQADIRRALAHLGRAPFFRYFAKAESAEESIEELMVAAGLLSERRIGAIIVIERQVGLRNYIEGEVGEAPVDEGPIIGVNVGGDTAPDPVFRPPTQDPLDGWALIPDQPVLAEDHDAVRGILDKRLETFFAASQVDEQQPLRGRLLLESAVLARQDARSATECQPDHGDQQARRDDGHDEHSRPRRVDALVDEAGILVDVVDADRIAVHGAADRNR